MNDPVSATTQPWSPPLSGKLALITGGTRGIGSGIALAMAAAGARVVVTGRDRPMAESVVAQIRQAGGSGDFLISDLLDDAEVDGLIPRVEHAFGSIDVLVNNAGIDADNPAIRHPLEDWQRVLRLNLEVPFRLCQAVAQGMLQRGAGIIINVSSVLGLVGAREVSSYAASKHGLIGLTKVLAVEWAAQGIRVNAIAPGLIQTDMTANMWDRPGAHEYIKRSIPAGRIGTPADVGGVAVFLASDAAAFVHGETIVVDGGFVAT